MLLALVQLAGNDVFGDGTFDRPWLAADLEPMEAARTKMAAAFEFFEKLGVPYFCFHDHDVAPTGSSFAEETANLNELADDMAAHMERTGVGLLWGTARLFGHPRYMAGAATNPSPEVYARAAAQVKNCMDVTHRLGGQNYVLWGGREGYETLLNTELSRELDQLGRFLSQVVEYKHHIGFRGTILLEPKPQEPTKHQYDYDSQSCFAFLQRYGLEDEVKVNIEVNHATLSGHDFQHELAMAQRVDSRLGRRQPRRRPARLGHRSIPELGGGDVARVYEILRAGGFTTGGFNFDTKLRRMSIARDDLFHAHIGGMDTLARPCSSLTRCLRTACWRSPQERYAGWETGLGADILHGNGPGAPLGSLHHFVGDTELDPAPVSGRQEELENSSTASSNAPLMPIVAGVDSSTQSCKVEIRDLDSGQVIAVGRGAHPPTSPLAASRTRTLGGPHSSTRSVRSAPSPVRLRRSASGASSTAWSCSMPTTDRSGPPSSGTTPSPPPKPPVSPRRSGPKPGPVGWVRCRSPRSRSASWPGSCNANPISSDVSPRCSCPTTT